MAAIDSASRPSLGWRTPLVIVICGSLIGMLTFGPRSSVGFFMQPFSQEFGWGRDVFALAFAVQNLLWGIGQPFAGAVADKFGSVRVICIGALMYAAGLLLMRYSSTPLELNLTAGLLIGFGLSGCSFNLVLSAFGKLMPPEWRGIALGGHGGWLVRPVHLRALHGGDDRPYRLAGDAGHIRHADAAGAAAGHGAVDAEGRS